MRLQGMLIGWIMFASVAFAEPGVVDDARLLAANADQGNWLTYGRDYSNRRF